MNILEEFWCGNVEPSEYNTSPDPEYKEIILLISRNEEKLPATMTADQKELFSRYTDCVREYQTMAECLLFQNSFRLGGRNDDGDPGEIIVSVQIGTNSPGQKTGELFHSRY